MKLTPKQHRKMAQDLRERAALSTIPEEREAILNKAKLGEYLANAKRPSQKQCSLPSTKDKGTI
jgi:hypothetical protein